MRTAVGTVLLALVVGLVAGCGKAHRTGIASANGGHGPGASPSASVDPEEQARQYAKCMREHGVDIPDPDPGGGGGVRIQAKPDDPTFKAAEEACKDKLPGALRGGGPGGAGGQEPGGRTTGDGP